MPTKPSIDSLSLSSAPPNAGVEALDAAFLLTTVFEVVGFSARAAGVRLTVDMPPRGLRLLGDRTQILEMVLTLTTKAIDAVGRGGLVTLAARRGEDREVVLEIADSGPGTRRGTRRRLGLPGAPDEPDQDPGSRRRGPCGR